MWRRHLINANYMSDDKLEYQLKDFGQIVGFGKATLLKLENLMQLYEIKTGVSYILNNDNSHKFYVIINGNISTNTILPKEYEGEIIGTIMYNPYFFNSFLKYNFRLCVTYFLSIDPKFFPDSKLFARPIFIKSDRSELVSYTRAHYHQLVKIFPSLNNLGINEIINIEKNKAPALKLYEKYKEDLEK